mmetsp:Transcript_12907/g.11032  ORF Transcript_12907/g.11032 Transcript_12907/m.11032 type:complete len:234 (+) Transcript_12907:131-832(+)
MLDSILAGVCSPKGAALSKDQILNIKISNYYSLFILIAAIFFYGSSILLTSGIQRKVVTILLGIASFTLVIFLTLCRKFPKTYKIVCSLLISSMSYIPIFFSKSLCFLSMAHVTGSPLFIAILTCDGKLTFAYAFIQYILLASKYIPACIEIFAEAQPHEVAMQIALFKNLILITLASSFMLGFIKFIQYKSYWESIINSKNKTELELQIQSKFLFKFSSDLKNPLNSMLGNL